MPRRCVFIACLEFFGGIFLALGLLSRITGLVLTVNMIMAYVIGDHEGCFLSSPIRISSLPRSFCVSGCFFDRPDFGAGKISWMRRLPSSLFFAGEAGEFSSSLMPLFQHGSFHGP